MEPRNRIDRTSRRPFRIQEIMRGKRHYEIAQFLVVLALFPPKRLVETPKHCPLRSTEIETVGHFALLHRLQPAREPRHRRQRHEGLEALELLLEFIDHLLDQEIAEGNTPEAVLAVRDRIEHRRRRQRPIARLRRRGRGKQALDILRDMVRQCDFHEDQRLVDQRRMEKAEAAAVRRIEPTAKVVPPVDLVDGFILDDLLEDRGRRLPVDPPQHEKAAVEP